MTKDRKVSANDVISGGVPTPPENIESSESMELPDGKMPGGLHPVVQQRLSRERAAANFESHDSMPPTPSASVTDSNSTYVTREEMQNFVADLNVQLGEISKWLNQVVTDNKTFKNTFMHLQSQMSNLQSKLNQAFRNQ